MKIKIGLLLIAALALAGADPIPPKTSGGKTVTKRFVSSPAAAPEESGGIISGFTQRIAKWFLPNQNGPNQAVEAEKSNIAQSASSARGVWASAQQQTTRGKKCSPCNSVPWVPIARAVGYNAPPPQHHDSVGHYSLQVPTINLKAIPVASQYYPPAFDYGRPGPEYDQPTGEYGPPKPENGLVEPGTAPPKPEYGAPSHQYSPPIPEQPPTQDYVPPTTGVGISQSVEINVQPPSNNFSPPPTSSSNYGPPSSGYGPPPNPSHQSLNDHSPPPELSPPEQGNHLPAEPHKQDYSPTIQDYGPPKQDYGPPKQDYGPPTQDYGPPKQDYGPPKQDYGPPKQDNGPPKQEYGPPNKDFNPPKPEYGPPKLENRPPKLHYGPPQLPPPPPPEASHGPINSQFGPPLKPQYGPPPSNYRFPKPLGSNNQFPKSFPRPQRPRPEYRSPKPNFSPPVNKVRAPNFALQPAPPLPPPTMSHTSQSVASGQGHNSLSYQQYLNPPPRPGDQYHSMRIQAIPVFADLASLPLAPSHTPDQQHHASSSAIILEAPKPHPNQFLSASLVDHDSSLCNKCPPTGPDLSSGPSGHHVVALATTEEAKNAIGNFGNLPLSDSAHEASDIDDVKTAPSTETPVSLNAPPHANVIHNNHHNQVTITKSVPLTDYLSSIEYPMQIVQAPILDIPELPKYFDLGYHNFHLKNQDHLQKLADSEKLSSSKKPLYSYNIVHTYQEGSDQKSAGVVPTAPTIQHFESHIPGPSGRHPSGPGNPQPGLVNHLLGSNSIQHSFGGQPSGLGSQPPRQYFDTGHIARLHSHNSTYYEMVPYEGADSQPTGSNWVTTSTSWGTPPRPFYPPTTTQSPKKTKHIHQFIVPYTTNKKPLQARKVPSEPTSSPDLQAIYVNRGVTAPAEITPSSLVNYPLTSTGSEQHDVQVPNQDFFNSLSPEVMNKLLEIGFDPMKVPRSSLQHILATDLRALLQGEEDSVDFVRLQKNIDTWTAEGYGKRVTIPQQKSKKIPEEYFTTASPFEEAQNTESHQDNDMAASQHFPLSYKVPHDKHYTHNKDIMDEIRGWSLLETEIKPSTNSAIETTTPKLWEELEVSISPLTQEKVYVVTPESVMPMAPDSDGMKDATSTTTQSPSTSTTAEMKYSSSRQLTTKDVDSTTETVSVVTPVPNVDDPDGIFSNDLGKEEKASVTYLGSASSLSSKSIAFQQTAT